MCNKDFIHYTTLTENCNDFLKKAGEWDKIGGTKPRTVLEFAVETAYNRDEVRIVRFVPYILDNLGQKRNVTICAMTAEDALARHYEKDFGAVKLPQISSYAPRFLIADAAAKRIFFSFLE